MALRLEPTIMLTHAMLQQLEAYVNWAEESGAYYGNKEQFQTRHAAIKEWLKKQSLKRKRRLPAPEKPEAGERREG